MMRVVLLILMMGLQIYSNSYEIYILDYLNGELIKVTGDKGIHETNCEWMGN